MNSLITFDPLEEKTANQIADILKENNFPVEIEKRSNGFYVRTTYDGVQWYWRRSFSFAL